MVRDQWPVWNPAPSRVNGLAHASVGVRQRNRHPALTETARAHPDEPGRNTWGREAFGASLRERPDRPVRPGEPISSVDIPEGWSRPGVIIQPLETTRYKRESLSTTWHRFFPEVSMTQGGALHGAIERGSQPVAGPPYPSMI